MFTCESDVRGEGQLPPPSLMFCFNYLFMRFFAFLILGAAPLILHILINTTGLKRFGGPRLGRAIYSISLSDIYSLFFTIKGRLTSSWFLYSITSV